MEDDALSFRAASEIRQSANLGQRKIISGFRISSLCELSEMTE
jgi:hypothetical protein